MKRIFLIIALLVLTMCMLGFSGCGKSEEPVAEESFEEEITEDEIVEDEYDPYVDGITLQEAKDGDYGTVFIKDNVLYYPLIPTYESDYISGMTIEESKVRDDDSFDDDAIMRKWYKVSPENTQYDLPKLTEERQLVEVQSESGGFVSKIAEKPVYTLPCMVYYSLDDYEDEDNPTKKPRWSIGFDDESSSYALKTIDGKEVGYKELDDLASNIPEAGFFSGYTEEHYKYFSGFNWEYLYKEYGLKPVRVDTDLGNELSVEMFFIKGKNESVSLNYRVDGDVDSNQETRDADVALYNMPDDINKYEKPEIYKYKYEQTDEGYSVIKLDDMPAGVYASDEGYLFRKE